MQPSELKRNKAEHLLQHMSDGYFLLDTQWCFVDINEQGRRILNAGESLLGRNIWEVFPHSVGTAYQTNYEKAVNTQLTVNFEVFSPRLQKWFECRAIPLGEDGLSVFFNDITIRKQHEDHQTAMTERLELALEASQLGMWEWFLQEERLIFSERAFRIFGRAPGTQTENFFTEFRRAVHPEDLQLVTDAAHHCIKTRSSYMIEYRIVWPDQSVHWVQAIGRTVFEPANEKPTRMLGTVIDITSRKQHQNELQRALIEAKSANELKSAFLANMSHEIRTPLGAILGFAEMLADPAASHEDRSQYVSIIGRNGRMLSRLIDDILDLSKVESGQLELENVRYSLRQTLESILPNLQLQAQAKCLPIELEIAPDVPDEILGDPTRLCQILVNLLQNAIKFTEKGSVQLKITADQEYLHFQIADTGIGISQEQAQKLFFAFRQADQSITRRYGGTGLGLALSKKLSHLLGGDIQLLESKPGFGSRFEVEIPLEFKKPRHDLEARPF
jgi:PAS domain S-box-containing protein